MVIDKSMSQQNKNTPSGGEKKESVLIWILFLFFMLAIFAKTTPFMYNFAKEQSLSGVALDTKISASVERFSRGNKTRQATMLVFVSVLVGSLFRTRNRFQINGLFGWTVIFYLGWILLSLAWSIDPLYTLKRVVVVYMMWLAAIAVTAQLSLRKIAGLAVFVTGMSLLIGIGNELRLNTLDLTRQSYRFSGVFHAITMAQNCCILILSAMFLVVGERRKKIRAALWFIVIIGSVFLLLTKSRTPVAAGIISIGLYWSYLVSLQKKLLIILGTVVCLSAAYVLIGDSLLYYGEQATTLGRGEEATEQVANLTGRVPLWKYSFKWAAERPLCGYGFTTFISPTTMDEIYRNITWSPVSLHSAYVNELLGTGFIGLSALVAMLILALSRALRLAKQMPQYYYFSAVVIWISIIYIMEAVVAYSMGFVTFFVMTCLARLAFLPAEDWT